MRRCKLAEFRKMFYTPGSAPALSTLRARIDRREIAGGGREGKRYYIDLDTYNRSLGPSGQPQKDRDRLLKNPLLKELF